MNLNEAVASIKSVDKNLLYLAAGTRIAPAYKNLSFDNVVLVDQEISRSERNGKILSVRSDCTEFAWECIKQKVKFDAVVIINEGCVEGGGSYPLHGDFFLGMLSPIVKDSYVHVACPRYYECEPRFKRIVNNFLDISFDRNEIDQSDLRYLDPGTFTSSPE